MGFASSAATIIRDSTIFSNTADYSSFAGYGGGIYNDNSTVSIYSSSNTGKYGGGIPTSSGYSEAAFSVTMDQDGMLTNPDGICRVDPDGLIAEGDENNNNCNTDTVTVEEAPTEINKVYLPIVTMMK